MRKEIENNRILFFYVSINRLLRKKLKNLVKKHLSFYTQVF